MAPRVARTLTPRVLAIFTLLAVATVGATCAGVLDGPGVFAVALALGVNVVLVHRKARAVAAAHRLALTDPLTDLGNRRLLLADLEAALAVASPEEPSAFALFDLDGFKAFNDGHGHLAGDALLTRVGARLAVAVAPHGRAYRIGGDEFCVLAPSRALAPVTLLTRASAALREEVDGLAVESSGGLVLVPTEAADAAAALRLADDRMYAAKRKRHGAGADPLDRSLAARLIRALGAGQLEVHYQPIVQLADGAVRGVEALVRWRDPERGLVAPADFVPAAERGGAIDELGAWVLEEACRQARAWRDLGLAPRLGVNVSPVQLRRHSFPAQVAATVARHRLEPGHVILELTETAWTLDARRMLQAVGELRAVGLRLALDDFGAGYSSLSRLLELPVDVIKIDRAFLRRVPGDPQADAVLAAIFQLARASGCDVVAEGIERPVQQALLLGHGCELGQGYALHRPQPAAAVTALLRAELLAERRGGAGAAYATAPAA